MSEPQPQSQWTSPPGNPTPGASVPTQAFTVPVQSLGYVMPEFRGRPGLVTGIGVVSIVVASLSILFSLVTVLQSAGYYMMSVMSATVSVAQARRTAPVAPPAPVAPSAAAPGAVPEVGPRGMNATERAAALAALTARQSLTPSRKRHLDAILASAGREMAADRVSESGTMPEMRSGETPPDYFVTPAGRLEVFNDRAVFYPLNNSPTVRASAPPPGTDGGLPDPAGDAADAVRRAGGVVVHDVTVTVPGTTGPAATSPAAALTPAEIQSIVQQAQSLAGNGLNPAQVTSLSNLLSAPGQQLVQPGAAQGSVVTAYAPAGAPAVIQFADGGSLTLGAQGNVVAIAVTPVMPTFSFRPLTLGLMAGGAVASLALAVYLLVCGILTLRQSPRARRLHFIYAFVKVPLAITAGLAAAGVARDLMAGMAGAAPGTTGFSLFSGITPIVLGCAYPLALLVVLNTRTVRDYYREPVDAAPGEFDAGRVAT